MADPRAFISFDFDNDKTVKALFAGQAKKDGTKITIEDWSSKTSLPQATWEKEIEEKIKKCNMLLVLVGKKMSSATGVDKEIQMAKDNDVPIFGVYVNDATEKSTLPTGLARTRTVKWEHDKIKEKIETMMSEGKNKVQKNGK